MTKLSININELKRESQWVFFKIEGFSGKRSFSHLTTTFSISADLAHLKEFLWFASWLPRRINETSRFLQTYLDTNISTSRSVEGEVISNFLFSCTAFKILFKLLNFYFFHSFEDIPPIRLFALELFFDFPKGIRFLLLVGWNRIKWKYSFWLLTARTEYDQEAVSRKPRKLFAPVKPLQNLVEPCDHRAVLFKNSKDEERFPSYNKFQAYTLPVFRYRWSKSGFTGPKTFRGFRETGLRAGLN